MRESSCLMMKRVLWRVDEACYQEQIRRLQRINEELQAEIERLRKLLA